MSDEIQLISDGDGLAVIGDPAGVEKFLTSAGLPSKALDLPRLSSLFIAGSEAASVASTLVANSGRWVKLSEESVQKIKAFGLMKGSTSGLNRAIVQAGDGKIKSIVEFSSGALANPALLSGAAGLMAQMAMKQAMDEITEYLAIIDAKVDDVLRAQKDAVLADMIGVGFALDEAITLRDQVGRVSEVTWSKVQATSMTVARTQGYALRQLDALAEKLEKKTKVVDRAKVSKEAETKVIEWLAVLARCVQLQDAFTVLELDRVLDASPDELDKHRLALKDARRKRLGLIARSTGALLARLDAAADNANEKVLLHPVAAKTVVESRNTVADAVMEFQRRLEVEMNNNSVEARRWREAATEARDNVLAVGAEGVDAARRLGGATVDQARAVTEKVATRVAERARRSRAGDENGGT